MTPVVTLGWVKSLRVLAALARDDRVDRLTELACAYPRGVVVRAPGHKLLVTAAPDAVKHVLVDNPKAYAKGMGQSHARAILGQGILTSEGEQWRCQREAVASRLRARAIHPHVGALVRHARESIAGSPGNADTWAEFDPDITLAQYTLHCLAEVFQMAPPDARAIHDAFDAIQDEALFRSITQDRIPLAIRPRARARVRKAVVTLTEQAQLALYARPGNESESWTSQEGMFSLFLAGYETTASALKWALYFLAGRVDLQAEMAREGNQLLQRSQPVLADTQCLEICRAVLKEVLRLRPPVWLISREVNVPDSIGGVRLDPGDEVLIVPGALQRNGLREPEEFDPSRFLTGAERGQQLWFGAGARACPGGNLAELEGSIWLACAMAHLEVLPLLGVPITARARMSQTPSPGPLVQVRHRHTVAVGLPSHVEMGVSS